ncbi:tripartite tricarboxylate transporter substrate binding protein [Verminephrobacter aporrectodeae subsp. tuberculatae]|uniref:Bug family tripartite tricarboxylate transporter substrate binding protein n=1 Tax=Verminephrobacter aporrectodeae TaxID=1110389 RepID=UPI0002375DC4|nr:tripartite tricarboxylate transporter substrate binding protein [Verminephrobacter aporrectodeae]MCW8166017.1 tripartite tricarboxylate transporter substrate binding protein [Verminephrobacter aporrectodeae subsp. tuberculatae]MCW8169720.1 tripartite tricarboxylate transporter substrate binding protein [Verminephrobacter aporrectodeae subsp. tuberculatae]MCW8207910.1 tripartite tricarboxylate transporter substrate binding protein [Verminephrobacter aporrectodeae subsp. tuberculatae]
MQAWHRRAGLLLAALAPLALLVPHVASAAPPWPEAKPIIYVVPFTPGGSTDIVGRTLANKLQESLKQSVVVENRPGQAGGIGAAYVAKAAPDGYTLFGGTISTHAINASLYPNLSYDPVKDFEPVALVARLPNVLIVNSQLGVNSVAELLALLRSDASRRVFASSGAGTSAHLAGEMFADLAGVKLMHVPYKGTPPALTDVAAGQVPFMFDQVSAALPLVKSGKLKLLAVTSAKRMELLPELPTMIESGVPGFEMSSWQAVYAPRGTPKPIVQRLNAEIVKALRQQDVQARLGGQLGMEIVGSTPEELRVHMAGEILRWAELVRKSGATAQ